MVAVALPSVWGSLYKLDWLAQLYHRPPTNQRSRAQILMTGILVFHAFGPLKYSWLILIFK